ncbi:prophage tail fiber N-terminal domain-containing protein [Serratia marcescens]|uniref:prophage tail fiber N-terminal domain-containing protein n=1 Tax=Serratia marcescens TaxID=615 RepID=UPI0028CFB333|nr:prophage tail fiber N-terminal domain-containing protein [Serratia marcescens]MDT8208222.1 prophage tail fiber N-terminal domain-containing protein [Serratia marcescens]
MAVLISGKLIGPNGDPRPNVTIMLVAVKTSSAVVKQAPSISTTTEDGSYSLSVEVGTHNVMIEAHGRPFEKAGQITVYNDSNPGTLNDFLNAPGQDELTPAIVAMVDDMRVEAVGAAASAKVYAEEAKASSEIAQSGTDAYVDVAEAQEAIDSGKETRRYFSVRSTISTQWVDEYENINGVATPTGRYLSNGKYVDEIAASVISLLASLIETNRRTASLRQYQSEKWQWLVEGAGGASETAMALDNDFGLWLAGLKSSIQDYIEQLMPKSIANRYVDLQYAIVAKNGIDGLLTINNNGDIRIVGTDDVLQDRLNAICSTTFSRRVAGFQFVIFTSDMKSAIFAIDDDGGVHIPGIDGPLQDNLGESLASIKTVGGVPAVAWRGDVVWSERPVLTAQKLSASGFVFSYMPGGEATAGAGVMYVPSLREMPVDAEEIQGGGSSGQSLNLESDFAGSNIVNKDPAFRGRLLAGVNGRPEGKNITPANESDVSTMNDMSYPSYRQGNILPLYTVLMQMGVGNVVFIHSAFAAGGRSFIQISKGTVPYENGLKFVKMAKNAADGVGKKYTFKFLSHEHGESDSDNGDNPNPGDYLARENVYFSGIQSDFKSITGQQDDFLIVIGQVGSRIDTKTGAVDEEGNPTGESVVVQPYSVPAVDQLAYVRQNSATAIMYGPKYPLNWLYNDNSLSHLNAKGKVLQGEYTAQAIHWHLYNAEKKGTWTGLKVKSLTVSGNIADLLCDVPYAPIVIDTTFISDCLNQGISLEKNSASVQSVTVVDGNIIRVEFDKAPASEDYMLIGFTNTALSSSGHVYPLTCFRDSSPIKSRWITRNNEPFPLYNWLCLDRLPMTGEF